MSQQIIVDIDQHYPFGQIAQYSSKARIFVRKISQFKNRSEYQKLKQKIQILKKLRDSRLIKLVNILQGQNQFHLIYEYIPNKFENSKNYFDKKQIIYLKQKIIQLAQILLNKNINTQLKIQNLGIDKFLQIRYYLDIQSFELQQNYQVNLKKLYINQTNQIFDQTDCENFHQNNIQNNSIFKKTQSKQSQDSNSNAKNNHNQIQKKLTSLEALNRIQQKINTLKINSKKYSPKIRDSFKSNDYQRQTVKQNKKKEKDIRKMSGHTIYSPYSFKKDFKIIKNQSTNNMLKSSNSTKERDFHQKINKVIPMTQKKQKNSIQYDVQVMEQIKQPTNKSDFQQMKKKEFKNFFKSKQSYVHEFLDILTQQEQDQSKKNLQQNKYDQTRRWIKNNQQQYPLQKKMKYIKQQQKILKSNSKKYQVETINQQLIVNNDNQKKIIFHKCRSLQKNKSPDQKIMNQQQIKVSSLRGMPKIRDQIKQRINIAIKQTDIALEKYRKNSIYSTYTQFKVK